MIVRSVLEMTTAESAVVDREEPLGETNRWGPPRGLPHTPASTAGCPQDANAPSAAPSASTVDPSADQNLSPATCSSQGLPLHTSTASRMPTALRVKRSNATDEETEFSIALVVGSHQAAAKGVDSEEGALMASSVKDLPQKDQADCVFEDKQQDFFFCKQQLEGTSEERQQQQLSTSVSVEQRNACSAWKQQQPESKVVPTAERQHQRNPSAPLRHKETSWGGELDQDAHLFGEQERATCSLPPHRQEHTLSHLQTQLEDCMRFSGQEQQNTVVRERHQQEHHGLDALLHRPLSSLAELISSSSPPAISRSSLVETSLTSAGEVKQMHDYADTKEGQSAQQEEQQVLSLQQQHPPQQLLTSAGDLLWRMGRRIGSGSRAAAEAAASAAAKAASAAAVATIGEPAVITVLPIGSLETRNMSFAGSSCNQERGGDNRNSSSSSSKDFIRADEKGSGSSAHINARVRSGSPMSNEVENISRSCSDRSSSRVNSDTPLVPPNEPDGMQSKHRRGVFDEEELLHERDALREQVRIYQEALAQLLEAPGKSQHSPPVHVDREEQQLHRLEEAGARPSGAATRGLSSPSNAGSYENRTPISKTEQQCTSAHRSSTPHSVTAPRAQDKCECTVAEKDLRVAASSGNLAAVAAAAADAADAAASTEDTFASGVDLMKYSVPDGRLPAVAAGTGPLVGGAAGGSDERDKKEIRVCENDSRTLRDGSWCMTDAARQLQRQLVEVLYERAASAAAAAATTAAEATMSTLVENGELAELIDPAAVAAATSVALTDDEDLLCRVHQLLKHTASPAFESMNNLLSSRHWRRRENAAVTPTFAPSTVSPPYILPCRRSRSATSTRERKHNSVRDHSGISSRDNSCRERNLYDCSGIRRSEKKQLRVAGNGEAVAVNIDERAQFLAKIQQQERELEQYRDINERQTKQLMQLTLQLTSFKTEADERKAEERQQYDRARHFSERNGSTAPSSVEQQEEETLASTQQQQLEELTRAAAESFSLKCHLQELSKMYTKAAEKEAALRQELNDTRRELIQQQQIAGMQRQQSMDTDIDQLQDLRTGLAESAAQDSPFHRILSPSALATKGAPSGGSSSAAAVWTETADRNLTVDAAVQTTAVGDFLPRTTSCSTVAGATERVPTVEASKGELIFLNSPEASHGKVRLQQKGTAEREAGAEAADHGTTLEAAAPAAARVLDPSKLAAAGFQTRRGARIIQLRHGGAEAIAGNMTGLAVIPPGQGTAAQADAVSVGFERHSSYTTANPWSGEDSEGGGREKEGTFCNHAVATGDTVMSTETALIAGEIATSGGAEDTDFRTNKVLELNQQQLTHEQERVLRTATKRIQSLEIELELSHARQVGERRRMRRLVLDLKALCVKEKRRREKAETQCERLMAAALEQQAFVLQNSPLREDPVRVYDEELRLLPSSPFHSLAPSSCTDFPSIAYVGSLAAPVNITGVTCLSPDRAICATDSFTSVGLKAAGGPPASLITAESIRASCAQNCHTPERANTPYVDGYGGTPGGCVYSRESIEDSSKRFSS